MMMRSYRSILALILALVTTFLVSCGSPVAKTPAAYTSEQIEQIQKLASTVATLRDRMPILEDKIRNQNWTDVGTYIHGPLGELRRSVNYTIRELLPNDQKSAREAAKDLFSRLETIDIASAKGNYQQALQNYQAAISDFDKFLQLIPGQNNSGASG